MPVINSANANSVNIESAKRDYHHGDLRSAAIAEGLQQLRTASLDRLSLRKIARNLGVSATALYRHFPDKAALLGGLAMAGAEQLGREQMAAFDIAGGGETGFAATGRAYVRFAIANPALFRLVMACTPANAERAGQAAADTSPMRFLHQNIAALLPTGAPEDARRVGALQAWALVHGLAMLVLDGQVDADDAMIERVIAGGVAPQLAPLTLTTR